MKIPPSSTRRFLSLHTQQIIPGISPAFLLWNVEVSSLSILTRWVLQGALAQCPTNKDAEGAVGVQGRWFWNGLP